MQLRLHLETRWWSKKNFHCLYFCEWVISLTHLEHSLENSNWKIMKYLSNDYLSTNIFWLMFVTLPIVLHLFGVYISANLIYLVLNNSPSSIVFCLFLLILVEISNVFRNWLIVLSTTDFRFSFSVIWVKRFNEFVQQLDEEVSLTRIMMNTSRQRHLEMKNSFPRPIAADLANSNRNLWGN